MLLTIDLGSKPRFESKLHFLAMGTRLHSLSSLKSLLISGIIIAPCCQVATRRKWGLMRWGLTQCVCNAQWWSLAEWEQLKTNLSLPHPASRIQPLFSNCSPDLKMNPLTENQEIFPGELKSLNFPALNCLPVFFHILFAFSPRK